MNNQYVKNLLDQGYLSNDQYNKVMKDQGLSNIFGSLGEQLANVNKQQGIAQQSFNLAMSHDIQQAQNIQQNININNAQRGINTGISNILASSNAQANSDSIMNLFNNQQQQNLILQQNKEQIGETIANLSKESLS